MAPRPSLTACESCGTPFRRSRNLEAACSAQCAVRILSKRLASLEGCWEWPHSVNNRGYGKIHSRAEGILLVHRVSYSIFVAPIGPGDVICHACDNPRCFRPGHLFRGTQADNLNDMRAKGRGAPADRLRLGGRKGEAHHGAVIAEADVLAIRTSSLPHEAVARQFGLSKGAVRAIRSGLRWKHVGGPIGAEGSWPHRGRQKRAAM